MKIVYRVVIVLIIALCVGAFYMGVQAPSEEDLRDDIQTNINYDVDGLITINTSKEIDVSGYIDGLETLTKTTTDSKLEWKFNANFNREGKTYDEVNDLVIKVRIKNRTSGELGAYFYSGYGLNAGLATKSSIKLSSEVKDDNNTTIDSSDDVVVASANLSSYSHIMPFSEAGGDVNEIDLVARVKMNELFSDGKEANLNLTINVEDYIPNVVDEVLNDGHSSLDFIKLSSSYVGNSGTVKRTVILEKTGFKGKTAPSGLMVVLPNTINVLGVNAFNGCTALESITLPVNVTGVGELAFAGCVGLERLTIDENNYMFTDGNASAIIEKSSSAILVGTKNTIIPNDVKIIGENAFNGLDVISRIEIPGSVVEIGENAFDGCINLETIFVKSGQSALGTFTLPEFEKEDLIFVSWYTSKDYKRTSRVIEITDKAQDTTYFARWAKNAGIIKINAPSFGVNVVGTINDEEELNQTVTGEYSWEISPEKLSSKNIEIKLTLENCSTDEVGAYFFSGEGLSNGVATLNSIKTEEVLNNFTNDVGNVSLSTYSHMMPMSYDRGKFVTMKIGIQLNNNFEGDDFYLLNYTLNLEKYTPNVTTGSLLGSQKTINFVKLSSSYMSSAKPITRETIAETTGFSAKDTPSEIIVVLPNTVKTIKDSAFKNCVGLKNINMPELLETVGNEAFRGCELLKYAEFSNNVKSIGNYAFCDNTSLKELDLSPSIKTIGYFAFSGCAELSSVSLYEGIESIGRLAFDGINESAFVEAGGISYIGNKTNPYVAAIKSSNDGIVVVDVNAGASIISNYAFYNISTIETLKTGAGVKFIGGSAFQNCTKLNNITLGTNVQKIGDQAFYCDKAFTELTLPVNLKSIGASAFYGCKGLIRLNIPEGVTSIGSNAFNGCENVGGTAIIPSAITAVPAGIFNGCLKLEGVKFGAGVVSIGDSAFNNCKRLSEMVLPSGLKTIGKNAFTSCESLTGTLNIPNTVSSIGDFAFSGCSGINGNINVPSSITVISTSAFNGCTGITNITLLNNVKEIKSGAFSRCENLTSIAIPETVTTIGENAFYNCKKLVGITIGDKVTTIGRNAFTGVPESNFATFGGGKYLGNDENRFHALIKAESTLTTACTTHSSTKVIASYAFEYHNISQVTITSNVYSVCDRAFYYCENLNSVTIENGVKNIGWGAFEYCTSLKSIVIPDSITIINSSLFLNCSSLESVAIGAGVTEIGTSAFNNCRSLFKINLPNSVTKIGTKAFVNCANLKSVSIGSRVWEIGENAFDGCPEELFTIVNGVKYLGNPSNAYQALIKVDKSLSSVTVNSKTAVIAGASFAGSEKLVSVTIPSSVKVIGSSAFMNCAKLSSVNLSEGITSIESKTFSGCTSLKSIKIPNTVKKIKSEAFAESGLAGTITISNNLESIGENAFSLTKIAEAIIGTGVQTISAGAFSYTSELNTVTFMADLPPKSVGTNIFGGCDKLKSIYVNSLTALAEFQKCANLAKYETKMRVK